MYFNKTLKKYQKYQKIPKCMLYSANDGAYTFMYFIQC